jgi:hypothetical protein
MRRRDFIKAISVSAAIWPLDVRAQQTEQMPPHRRAHGVSMLTTLVPRLKRADIE